MTDIVGGRGGGFDIGRVIERTFGVVGGNFLVFAGLALLLTALPQMVLGLASAQTLQRDGLGGLSALAGISGLVNLVGAFVLQAALVHGAVADMNGRKASFGDCLRTGLSHFLPVFAITLLMIAGITLGLILLIVPGLMLMVAWTVAVPARVVEKTGVFRSFGRSAELTRGSRWAIFGLFVIYFIIAMVVGGIFVAIAAAVTGGAMDGLEDMLVVQAFVSPVVDALVAMIGASGVAAIYYELRSQKEGIGPEALASVFD